MNCVRFRKVYIYGILFLFSRKDLSCVVNYIKCSSLFCFFFTISYPICREELLIRLKDEGC